MAKETYGYTAPQYFYWAILDGGGKYIKNGSWNFEMKKYTNYIDEEPGKVWDHPRIYAGKYWKYNFVNDGKYDKIKYDLFDDYYNGYYEQVLFPTVSGSGAKLTGTGKNDSISNSGAKANINAGAGNDSIGNVGDNVTINAGADNDRIENYGSLVTIFSGAGSDSISNSGDKVTILAGAGNDTIISSGKKNIFLVNDGGNKVIYGFGNKDTLRITDADGTFSKKK